MFWHNKRDFGGKAAVQLGENTGNVVADPGFVQQTVAAVIEKHGRINGLFNNAGMMVEQLAENTCLAEWELTLRVNLTAPFLMMAAAIPAMRIATATP